MAERAAVSNTDTIHLLSIVRIPRGPLHEVSSQPLAVVAVFISEDDDTDGPLALVSVVARYQLEFSGILLFYS